MAEEKKGKLVVFEGIDGSGKSTHARLLVKWLLSNGYNPMHTEQPSKGKIGSLLWGDYLKRDVNPLIDVFLFLADRVDHIDSVIKPALEEGKIVICERYMYSTLAYQGAEGMDVEWLRSMQDFVIEPDLIIHFDLTPEEAVKRTYTKDKFEKVDILKKVRAIFQDCFNDKDNVLTVDTSKSIEEISEKIRGAVADLL